MKAASKKTKQNVLKQQGWYLLPYAIVLAVWLAYLIISVSTPYPKNSPLRITHTQLILIRISVLLAYLITWMAAAYALTRLWRYSRTIKKSKEARGFSLLALGIAILLGALLLATLISSINSRISGGGSPSQVLTMITNYLYVFPFLAAFWCLWLGSRFFIDSVKAKPSVFLMTVLGVILLAFMYLWLNLIFTNPLRNASPAPNIPSTYYLGDSMIVFSIVMPCFVGWALGIAAALNLRCYGQKVQGKIYRSSISALVWGFWAVIVGSVFLEGLQALGNIRLIKLGLAKLLILIYVFLALQLIGYLYIALGAKRLAKIETV